MKTITLTLAALLGAAAMAEARLFETEAECEARYGKPVKSAAPELPATRAWSYRLNGISVTIQFVDGRAWFLDFPYVKAEQKEAIVKANLGALGPATAEKSGLLTPYIHGAVLDGGENAWRLRIVAKDWESLGDKRRAQRAATSAKGF